MNSTAALARPRHSIASPIESYLGGSDRLNAIERALVEGFAGAAVTLQHLNTQLALGQPIDRSMLKAVITIR